MIVEPQRISEVVLVRPRRFSDDRGYFVETFSARSFRDRVKPFDFVQDNEALSGQAGTIRGLHFQSPPAAQGKLVRVVQGAIIDVAVDIRQGSPTFGQHISARLDAKEGAQLWMPPGFAHGYCTLVDDTLVAYKVTEFYNPACERGLLWNDPALGIDWHLDDRIPILAAKDGVLPGLADLPPVFRYDSQAL